MANYLATMRAELKSLAHVCGVAHPALIGPDRIELLDGSLSSRTAADVFGYRSGWGIPDAATIAALHADSQAGRRVAEPAHLG